MKLSHLETDREKVPMMKELHELGLKYGVRMVVVAVDQQTWEPQAYIIDHMEESNPDLAAAMCRGAGDYLLDMATAITKYVDEQEDLARAEKLDRELASMPLPCDVCHGDPGGTTDDQCPYCGAWGTDDEEEE